MKGRSELPLCARIHALFKARPKPVGQTLHAQSACPLYTSLVFKNIFCICHLLKGHSGSILSIILLSMSK